MVSGLSVEQVYARKGYGGSSPSPTAYETLQAKAGSGQEEEMVWDRSKQTYWVLRRGNPWKVISMKDNREVCDFPAYGYHEKIDELCFAESDEKVKQIVEEIKKDMG